MNSNSVARCCATCLSLLPPLAIARAYWSTSSCSKSSACWGVVSRAVDRSERTTASVMPGSTTSSVRSTVSRESRGLFRIHDKTSNPRRCCLHPWPPAQQHQLADAADTRTHGIADNRMTPDRSRDEAGAVTAIVAVFLVALLAVAALVYDGGRAITAKRRAINRAEQAARAGARALDAGALRAGADTPVRLDERAAAAQAQGYLDGIGATGSVEVTGAT